MLEDGVTVSAKEMQAWYGAKKEAVFANFIAERGGTPPGKELDARVARCAATFEAKIMDA